MENEIMIQILFFTTLIAPIAAAFVELVKRTINIRVNFIPLLSLVIGLLVGAAGYPFTDMDLTLRLWAGAFAGLSGTGLYELINNREKSSK